MPAKLVKQPSTVSTARLPPGKRRMLPVEKEDEKEDEEDEEDEEEEGTSPPRRSLSSRPTTTRTPPMRRRTMSPWPTLVSVAGNRQPGGEAPWPTSPPWRPPLRLTPRRARR